MDHIIPIFALVNVFIFTPPTTYKNNTQPKHATCHDPPRVMILQMSSSSPK